MCDLINCMLNVLNTTLLTEIAEVNGYDRILENKLWRNVVQDLTSTDATPLIHLSL